jgi:hypothetical protein
MHKAGEDGDVFHLLLPLLQTCSCPDSASSLIFSTGTPIPSLSSGPESFLGKTSLTSEAVSNAEVEWIALKLYSRLPHVMSTSDKPMGKKRALLIAVRHVRGIPEQHTTGLVNLPWAHRDAKNLKDRLIGTRRGPGAVHKLSF